MQPLFPKSGRHPWLKPGVFAGVLVPLAVIAWRGAHGQLGADPVAAVLNQLGYLALTLLVATLLCTPLKIVTGWTWGIKLRRTLGLFAFFYASLHFLTYFVVDQGLDLRAVVADITKRRFILVGFLAFVILIALAVTSPKRMVRRMGFARWKRLHRLAYVAGSLGVIHFIWRVKKDLHEPLIFAAILGVAFALRALDALRRRARKTGPSTAVRPETEGPGRFRPGPS
jgi:sulfoxide reductase heme-binding subunit YedZ